MCVCGGAKLREGRVYRIHLISAWFIFRGFAIFVFFCVFTFAVAGYSGVEIFAGEMFADIRSKSVYRNSIQQLQRICLKMSCIKWRVASEDFTSTKRYGRLSLEKGLVAPTIEATEKIHLLLQ